MKKKLLPVLLVMMMVFCQTPGVTAAADIEDATAPKTEQAVKQDASEVTSEAAAEAEEPAEAAEVTEEAAPAEAEAEAAEAVADEDSAAEETAGVNEAAEEESVEEESADAAIEKADAVTEIDSVTIKVNSRPKAGQKNTDVNPDITVSGKGISKHSEYYSSFKGYSTASESFTFKVGQTYYICIHIYADSSYAFKKGSEKDGIDRGWNFGGDCSVTGGATLNSAVATAYSEAKTMVVWLSVSAVGGARDVYIDNTVDNSKSYVTGTVLIKGTGGEQYAKLHSDLDVYNGVTVYSDSASVSYSDPKTSQVQTMINEAYDKSNAIASDIKARGKSGEFNMSTSEETGKVWDNRKYETFEDSDAVLIGDSDYLQVSYGIDDSYYIRTHIASGDYGKETHFKVEANGWVNGWDIKVSDDGNGTGSADYETSLAEETVTLTATANDGYVFKEWQVVSGGAKLAGAASASTTFEMPYADVEIKAVFESAHTHSLVKTDKVDATCTEDGTEAYWTCSDCGKMFSDEAGTKEISKPVTIAALGHDFGEWTETKAATCTEKGTEERVCKRDPSHKETRDIDALGHTAADPVKENEKAATCTEDGSYDEVVYCSVCGKEISRETKTIAALGHDFGEWTETKAATCTEKGTEERVCKRDPSHKETRDIDALGHTAADPVIENEVAPTFTSEGSYDEVVYCSVCGEEISRATKKIPAISYVLVSGDNGTYVVGSGDSLSFTFKRTYRDEETFSHFSGVQVDGEAVDSSAYTAAAGSVVVTLGSDYLETLSEGGHTLTAVFEDGNNVNADFTVSEAAADDSDDEDSGSTSKTSKGVKTGDESNIVMWSIMLAAALAGMMYAAARRRRTDR